MGQGFFRNYPDFTRLWIGQSISQVGSQVTLVALPLLAISTLHASTFEVGLLAGSETLPFLLLGLPTGVWVDRWRRLPILVTSDIVRAVLLVTIPIAYAFGSLHMAQLYVVALGAGVCTVFFDVAYQSFVPGLVEAEDLIDANARAEMSFSAAGSVGPGLGGLLVQVLKAPAAMLVDAASFAISALALVGIKAKEEQPAADEDDAGAQRPSMLASVKVGLAYVLRHPLLQRLAACSAVFNIFSGMSMAVFLLYAVRELDISPATIGLIFSAGGLGALVGTLATAKAGRRWGVGTALSVGAVVQGTAFLLVPAAPQSSPVPWFLAAMLLESAFNPLYNVTQLSLRQSVTPSRLYGRMTASMRFLVWGALPVGSLLGGIIGSHLGLRTALWIGAVGQLTSALPVVIGPLRKLKAMPAITDEAASAAAPATG